MLVSLIVYITIMQFIRSKCDKDGAAVCQKLDHSLGSWPLYADAKCILPFHLPYELGQTSLCVAN